MSELVANCPRCGAQQITFDVKEATPTVVQYNWQRWFEAFCVCRRCHRSTIFKVAQIDSRSDDAIRKNGGPQGFVNVGDVFSVEGYISLRDADAIQPPDHLPPDIAPVFEEGAKCFAIGCWNAAGTMFRLCLDLATAPLVPSEDVAGLTGKIRRDLGLRLPWLITNGYLAKELKGLSDCIREDGNDGAHRGSLSREDAADILDFTDALLERLFTEPARLKQAEERRAERRAKTKT